MNHLMAKAYHNKNNSLLCIKQIKLIYSPPYQSTLGIPQYRQLYIYERQKSDNNGYY